MKIIFMGESPTDTKEHESEGEELESIFKIAEKATEADLQKISTMCKLRYQKTDMGSA